MNSLSFTLVSEGSSDALLCRHLEWLLKRVGVRRMITWRWADLRMVRPKPPKVLNEKIRLAAEKYPAEILFIHRDADNKTRGQRSAEIRRHAEMAFRGVEAPPNICVVPVRMQETWLLINDRAIRRAAGNPNGKMRLNLPLLGTLESESRPKLVLREALRKASGKGPRRLTGFNETARIHKVAEYIEDFSPLLKLPAFKSLHDDLAQLVSEQKWDR